MVAITASVSRAFFLFFSCFFVLFSSSVFFFFFFGRGLVPLDTVDGEEIESKISNVSFDGGDMAGSIPSTGELNCTSLKYFITSFLRLVIVFHGPHRKLDSM